MYKIIRGNMKTRKRRSNPDGSLSKVMLREQIAFATATRDAMVKLGARQVYPAYENKEGSLVVSMGVYEMDTKAGPLRVSCSGDSICTHFVYPQCEGNGKWNFHKFHVGLDFRQDDPERKLLALFLERLRPMLREPRCGDLMPNNYRRLCDSCERGFGPRENMAGGHPVGCGTILSEAS